MQLSYHHPNREKTTHYMHDYRGQADYFGIYCPETSGVYLVPVDEIGLRQGNLRIASPKNGQQKNIRWAREYEVGRPARPSRESAPSDIEDALPLWPA